ncbi:MAG: RNA polymerase sigma factor [Pseudomonadales bacterium]
MTSDANPSLQHHSEDRELVAKCLAGDESAWHKLIDRYQKLIYSVARIYFKSGAADDVFQDVCLELYKHLDSVRDIQSLPAWLITVTKRACQKAMNKINDWQDIEEANLSEVDKRITAIEQRFWLEQVIGILSDRDSQLIQALYLDPAQPSYEEISTQLNIPTSSIGPTRARILKKLREQWDG